MFRNAWCTISRGNISSPIIFVFQFFRMNLQLRGWRVKAKIVSIRPICGFLKKNRNTAFFETLGGLKFSFTIIEYLRVRYIHNYVFVLIHVSCAFQEVFIDEALDDGGNCTASMATYFKPKDSIGWVQKSLVWSLAAFLMVPSTEICIMIDRWSYRVISVSQRAFCAYCHDRIWGLGRQGFKCIQCKLLIHKKCHKLIQKSCSNESVEPIQKDETNGEPSTTSECCQTVTQRLYNASFLQPRYLFRRSDFG